MHFRNTLQIAGIATFLSISIFACDEQGKHGNRAHSKHEGATYTDKTMQMDLKPFEELEVGSVFDITIQQGTQYHIDIQSSKMMLDKIRIDQIGNELKLGVDKDFLDFNSAKDDFIKVTLTVPDLKEIKASGASKVVSEFILGKTFPSFELNVSGVSIVKTDVESPKINVELSGTSQYDGKVITEKIKLEQSGAAKSEISGKSNVGDVSLSGASYVNAAQLSADSMELEGSGASQGVVNVQQYIDVNISGASSFKNEGNAVSKVKNSGASSFSGK